MAHVSFNLALVAVLLISQGASAKRGCSAFGHSCFGGHGKRSGGTSPMDSLAPDLGRRQGQEETPPAPVYPRPRFVLPDGDDIIPVRDGGVYDRDDDRSDEAMRFKLRNIIKHWMDNYRRSQNDDGYLAQVL